MNIPPINVSINIPAPWILWVNGCSKISMFMMFMVSICWRELLPIRIHTWKSISREAALGTDCAAGIVFFIPRGQKTPWVVKPGGNHGKVMEKTGQIWYNITCILRFSWENHLQMVDFPLPCLIARECKGKTHLKRKPWFLPCYRRHSSVKFAWNKAWLRSGGHKSSLPVLGYQLPEVYKNNNVEINWTFWNMVNISKPNNHLPVGWMMGVNYHNHPEEGYQPSVDSIASGNDYYGSRHWNKIAIEIVDLPS